MTEPDYDRCVATAHCRNQQAPGLLVCRGHLERMGVMLRDIEDQAAILSAVPSMAIRNGSRGGSLASHRAPARLDVIVHIDRRRGTGIPLTGEPDLTGWDDTPSILDVLHSWARVVREDRALTPPARIAITTERDTLTRHLDWIAAQPWVDEFYTEVNELAAALESVNGAAPDKPAGRCYLPNEEGGTCTGRIWRHEMPQPVWRIKADRCDLEEVRAPAGSAYCDECRTTWEGADLVRLLLILEREMAEAARPRTADGRRMLTAEELVAQGYVSSVSNVRVTAHRLGVRAVDGHYDPDWFQGKISA